MPAPGAGGVQTSLTGMVQGMMASARNTFRRKPNGGAPIYPGANKPPDGSKVSLNCVRAGCRRGFGSVRPHWACGGTYCARSPSCPAPIPGQ